MSKPNWTLERVPRMGGATGEAFVNTLQGTGMTTSSVLARQAIQKSADAWRQDSAGKVVVWQCEIGRSDERAANKVTKSIVGRRLRAR